MNEEIVEIHRLSTELKMRNPRAHWSAIKDKLRTQLKRTEREDLLLKLDKLWGLVRQVIPLPPACICGNRVYSYTYRREESGHWEIFARCTDSKCRYMRRFLPSASYGWSRPKAIVTGLPPTLYELDGQRVEGER